MSKPVAWMSIQEGIFSPSFKYLFSETEKQGFIPLYTNPIKQLSDDKVQNIIAIICKMTSFSPMISEAIADAIIKEITK